MIPTRAKFEGIRAAIACEPRGGKVPWHITCDLHVSKRLVFKVKRMILKRETLKISKPVGRPRNMRTPAFCARVASNGKKMAPIYIREGERVTADVYIELLRAHVVPWIKSNYQRKARVC